jgi:hypothetical protein
MRAPNCLKESATNSPLPFPDQCNELANFIVRVVAILFVPNEHCQHHFGLPVRKLDCSSHSHPRCRQPDWRPRHRVRAGESRSFALQRPLKTPRRGQVHRKRRHSYLHRASLWWRDCHSGRGSGPPSGTFCGSPPRRSIAAHHDAPPRGGTVDANGQALMYLYCRDSKAEAIQARCSRRIAVNVAWLPEPLAKAD